MHLPERPYTLAGDLLVSSRSSRGGICGLLILSPLIHLLRWQKQYLYPDPI